jgi:hypothetical protein
VQAFFTVAVIIVGRLWITARRRREEREADHLIPHRDPNSKADNQGG